ncbi:MAG: TolC family protein, partial [Bacteroidaceae bacterium]|nr:TolC family protein [Bacteroidaceae bacterium]
MLRLKNKWLWIVSLVCLLSVDATAQISMTLDDALNYSIEHSPDLQRALMNLRRYEFSLKAQRASLKSKFSLTLNPITYSRNRYFENRLSEWYTNESFASTGTFSISQPIIWTGATVSLNNRFGWQNNKSSLTGGENDNRAYSNDLYLSITQPLFRVNQIKLDFKNIELDYENALINYALQRLNLENSITNQFYNVYTAQNSLEISRAELKDAEANYTVIKNKVDADLSTKDELYQAELNLATAKSTVDNRIVSLDNAKDDFKKVLGIDLDTNIEIIAQVTAQPVTVDLGKAIANALGSRLELKQREISRTELDLQMKQIKETNSFNGELSLSIGIIGDNEKLGDIYKTPTNNPRVSLSFNVPIFDWGERKARIRAQEIAIEMHNLETDEEKKAIEIAIRKSYRNLNNLLTQISIAEKSVKNAQLTYDLNAERYRNGEITGMEMNQFQTQLSNRKMSYVSTIIEYKKELLNMKILTLYDFETDKAIIPLNLVPATAE